MIDDGEQYVVRFKIELGTDVHVDDMIVAMCVSRRYT